MTMLEVRSTSTVPAREWQLMTMQADALARSDIIPRAYQRKPANVLVAAITGRHYGWDVLTAMRNGHVIEGSWGMKPEAMLGLVRLAGHSVRGDIAATGASVSGTRSDTGDTMTIGFTVDDAVAAGLCTIKDGKPYARSSSGKRLPWEQYPAMMCYWRAVGLLCRVLFSDLTAGVHSAEELGAAIGEDGDIIDVETLDDTPDEPMVLSEEALDKFREACEQVGLDQADVLAEAFPDGVPEQLTDQHLPAMRDAYRARVERNALVDEARASVALDGDTQSERTEETDGSDVGVESTRPATRSQVGKVKGEYERLGIVDREEQLNRTAQVIARTIDTHNHLTYDEASALIEHLIGVDEVAAVEVVDG